MHVRTQLTLVLLSLALFSASSTAAQEPTKAAKEPTKAAKEPTKEKASRERSGCICIKFMHANLGATQVYYAHEYDECIEEFCPFPYVTYITGDDLTTDQECPDECMHAEALKEEEEPTEGPQLSAAKLEDFDLHDGGDPDVELNPDVRTWPKGSIKRYMRTPDRGVIPIKIFFTRVRAVSVTATAAFGVEIDRISDAVETIDAEKIDDHVYRVWFHGHHECLVVTAQ